LGLFLVCHQSVFCLILVSFCIGGSTVHGQRQAVILCHKAVICCPYFSRYIIDVIYYLGGVPRGTWKTCGQDWKQCLRSRPGHTAHIENFQHIMP
jgi:hypothetical protein